jgi:hypothetical protein
MSSANTKDAIQLFEETALICPCIKQMHTGTLYPGFLQTCSDKFINLNKIIYVEILMRREDTFSINITYEFDQGYECDSLADFIDTKEDAEIILHEIMRIITMR